jgi:adenylylsulfate kinase-like enzyme
MTVTILLTGLSGAGKSTVAEILFQQLQDRGLSVELLNNPLLKPIFFTGYSREEIIEYTKQTASLCKLLTQNGVICIWEVMAHYREGREFARVEIEHFIEVFVDCPLSVCQTRDVKGFYKRFAAQGIQDFTSYEVPLHPELVIRTDREEATESAQHIIELLQTLGYID